MSPTPAPGWNGLACMIDAMRADPRAVVTPAADATLKAIAQRLRGDPPEAAVDAAAEEWVRALSVAGEELRAEQGDEGDL